jgi:hypothetical protein
MNMPGRLSGLILTLFAFTIVQAQLPDIQVKENFNSRPLTELIESTESANGLKFFFLKERTDSIFIVQKETPCKLETLIAETLAGTKLTYYADNNNVIFTYNYRIQPELPSWLLTAEIIRPGKVTEASESSFLMNENDVQESPAVIDEVITIGKPGIPAGGSKITLSGVVREKETGLPVTGALVFLKEPNIGTSTDIYGYYILSVPAGMYSMNIRFMGRKDVEKKVLIKGNGTLDLFMEEHILELRGVVVTADKGINAGSIQPGIQRIDNEIIKLVPSSMGEGDIIKTALLLPGVQTVGEGTSGFNVRGGGTDQNLILLDGAPLFNSSHLFGFISVFNPDIVKDFTLYKSAIPAQFGGRLSSVLDVNVRNGNLKKISLSGGISPVSARLCLDGPIVKDKATFLISARSSYSDWLLERTDIQSLENSSAYFLDINSRADIRISENNQLTFSGYYSHDYFSLNSDTLYSYNNLSSSLNLKHTFSKKLYALFTAIYSNYSYSISSEKRIPYAFDLRYSINFLEGRTDFKWFLSPDHDLSFGASINEYLIDPGTMRPIGDQSLIIPRNLDDERSAEAGIYLSDDFRITDKLSISSGLRYSHFLALGPAVEYTYLPDSPRSLHTRTDSTVYQKNEITYQEGSPEIRFSARYKTGELSSVKVSYTKMNQYLHMISNTTAISPTDMWTTSGPNIPGQKSHQVSAGFYKDFRTNGLESSVEVYYKKSVDILEYRGGTVLLMNPDLEVDLLNGIGKAYGMEILFKKKYGALNGWVSYTYSRSLIKVDSKYLTDQINKGEYFPSNYDKPHDLTLVANYKFSRNHSISSTLTYSTGRPITYPVGKYRFRDRELLHYSYRNEYRVPDYFRWDIALNIEGKLRVNKRIHDSMSLSVYNVTGRDNAYSIYFVSDITKNVKGYKLSVFAQPVFSVSYNFRF